MKKITKEINETVESQVTGFSFKVTNDKIEQCIIIIGENSKFSKPVKKIIVPAKEIPKELLQALDAFIDARIDNEIIIDPSLKLVESYSKKGKK